MIRMARTEEMDEVRNLFREYQDFLDFDLCFQSFERELADLPGDYALPMGCLYLALQEQNIVGSIAIRPLKNEVCEMKRLYLRPPARSRGLGRALCTTVIDWAQKVGYKKMKLDTVSKLQSAIQLYRNLGFLPCEQYCENPQPDVEFFELSL